MRAIFTLIVSHDVIITSNMERKELLRKKKESEECLSRVPREFEEHLKEAHNGIIASACHKCIVFKQTILSNTWLLEDLESGKFDTPPTS